MNWIIGVAVGLAVIVIAIFGIDFYLTPQDELEKSDAIVAISGGDTEARTMKAVELYKEGWAPKLLFSGAAIDPLSPSNAKVMKNVALRAGVPEEDIIIEETAANTEQNAKKSQGLLDSTEYKRIILVTSPYHQRRAYLEFNDKLDNEVEIINQSSSDKNWSSKWWLTPQGWWLGTSETVKTAATAVKNVF